MNSSPRLSRSLALIKGPPTSPLYTLLDRKNSELATHLIQPLFVRFEHRELQSSLDPSCDHWRLLFGPGGAIQRLASSNVTGVVLFAIPSRRDEHASCSLSSDNPVLRATHLLKKYVPEIVLIADLCVCQYVPNGHCRLTLDGKLDNTKTIHHLLLQAKNFCNAGVDILMPSGVLPGLIKNLRTALTPSFPELTIVDQASKFASTLYRPFRRAAFSTTSTTLSKSYQIPVGDFERSRHAIERSLQEGADALVLKPSLGLRRVLTEARADFPSVPIFSFVTSGEHHYLRHLRRNHGWKTYHQTVEGLRSDGSDLIISYDTVPYLESL